MQVHMIYIRRLCLSEISTDDGRLTNRRATSKGLPWYQFTSSLIVESKKVTIDHFFSIYYSRLPIGSCIYIRAGTQEYITLNAYFHNSPSPTIETLDLRASGSSKISQVATLKFITGPSIENAPNDHAGSSQTLDIPASNARTTPD